jgi:hypothetical protein
MSGDKTVYAVANGDVVSEQFEEDFVVLDLNSGRYFALGGAAAQLWQALIAGVSVEAILAKVADKDGRHASIYEFIGKLTDYGLIAPAERTGVPVAAPAELARIDAGLDIQVFDDLAELLIADPIHDVDEDAGWPHRKA